MKYSSFSEAALLVFVTLILLAAGVYSLGKTEDKYVSSRVSASVAPSPTLVPTSIPGTSNLPDNSLATPSGIHLPTSKTKVAGTGTYAMGTMTFNEYQLLDFTDENLDCVSNPKKAVLPAKLQFIPPGKSGKKQFEFEANMSLNSGFENRLTTISGGPRQTSNFDDDKDQEMITNWVTGYCNPGPLEGIVLFDERDNGVAPVAGYPADIFQYVERVGYVVVLATNDNTPHYFPMTDHYNTDFSYKDLNHDGKTDILFRYFDKNDGRCADCGHVWKLRVYEFKDSKFEIAPWWNHGQFYIIDRPRQTDNEDGKYLLELFTQVMYK
jgi:hypothetical protein